MPTTAEHAPLESPVALQLRRGYPWLRFFEPLESEFRDAYRTQSTVQVRLGLWLALALVLAFAVIDQQRRGEEFGAATSIVRYGIVVPVLLIAILLASSRWYDRAFAPIAQVLAPIVGLGAVALDQIALQEAADLASARVLTSGYAGLVLTTIYIYLLIGLRFYAALRTAVILLLAYVIGALIAYPSVEMAIYNSLLLLFANVVGATVCYTLEKANRTNFLEARLLAEMASRDGLTGIYNRRMLDEHLDRVWQQATRDRVPIALLLIDIDHFKAYNDYFGHQAGDECLRSVAHALARSARRPLDFTARYGGEEFAVVLYDARRDYVEELATRIEANVRSLGLKHPISPAERFVTVSLGAACVTPVIGRSRFGFVQLADEALYAAKDAGRNRLVVLDKEYAALTTGSFRKAASGTG